MKMVKVRCAFILVVLVLLRMVAANPLACLEEDEETKKPGMRARAQGQQRLLPAGRKA
jgi:hypothetical protein